MRKGKPKPDAVFMRIGAGLSHPFPAQLRRFFIGNLRTGFCGQTFSHNRILGKVTVAVPALTRTD